MPLGIQSRSEQPTRARAPQPQPTAQSTAPSTPSSPHAEFKRAANIDALGSVLARSVARRALLQRYYTARLTTRGLLDPPTFASQDPKPEVQDAPQGAPGLPVRLGHKIEHHPSHGLPVAVADDDSMLVHKTPREAKEFYASDEVIADANRKLSATHSAFGLDAFGRTFKVGSKDLRKIRPVNKEKARKQEADQFSSMVAHVCVNMAAHVMGVPSGIRTSEMVVTDPADPRRERAVNISPGSTDDPTVTGLAHAASRWDLSGDALDESLSAQRREEEKLDVGKQYGRHYDSLVRRNAPVLGINEFALPDVGEAYAIYSNLAGPTGKSDFTRQFLGAESAAEPWGYHYAGVVARSEAGDDRVTLENYNRQPGMEDALLDLQKALIGKFARQLGKTANDLLIRPEEDATARAEKLRALIAKIDQAEAARLYYLLLCSYEPETRWFFRMYGVRPGQTFHEQASAGPDHVNPMTIRVRQRLSHLVQHNLNDLAEERLSYVRAQRRSSGITDLGFVLIYAFETIRRELDWEEVQLPKVRDRGELGALKMKFLADRKIYYEPQVAKAVADLARPNSGDTDPTVRADVRQALMNFYRPEWLTQVHYGEPARASVPLATTTTSSFSGVK